MKTLMMILMTAMMTTPAFARTGFVYESLTQTGAKFIVLNPMWTDGKLKYAIEDSVSGNTYADDAETGLAVCRAFGFKSGSMKSEGLVETLGTIQLAQDGSIYNVAPGGYYRRIYSAVCSYVAPASTVDSKYPPQL